MPYLSGLFLYIQMITLKEIDNIVEKAIAETSYKGDPQTLYDPFEYMMSIGGKHLRPKMCLSIFNLFSDRIDNNVIYPALALEVFHEFTLVHDDIMDKSDTRRGLPTVHIKWSDNSAILSGDVMLIFAYKFLAQTKPELLCHLLSVFTDTAIKICEGQQYDMDFETMKVVTMDDYMKMIGLKTAVLIGCAAKMGAILAGRNAAECDAFYKFGYQIGIAFQITDDYLDTFGNQQIFGKKIGGDITNNKKTWLLIDALHNASGAQRQTLEKLLAQNFVFGTDEAKEKIAAVTKIYQELGVKERAQEAILSYHKNAMETLSNIGLSKSQTEQLNIIAEQLIHREK